MELQSDNRLFDITVPSTNIGTKSVHTCLFVCLLFVYLLFTLSLLFIYTRLLCSIVDNVEALIDEWFPGLRDFDMVHGDELVKPLSLCPLCPSE